MQQARYGERRRTMRAIDAKRILWGVPAARVVACAAPVEARPRGWAGGLAPCTSRTPRAARLAHCSLSQTRWCPVQDARQRKTAGGHGGRRKIMEEGGGPDQSGRKTELRSKNKRSRGGPQKTSTDCRREWRKEEEVQPETDGFCTVTAVHLRTVFVPSSIYCVCDNLNGR